MVSIIIPIFNAQGTIGPVLRAMVKSNFGKKYEIILVDDGSRNISIVKRIIASLPGGHIRLLRQEHKGPAAARNLGAKVAKGDILVFMDADVVLEPESLGQIDKNFANDKNLVALNGVYSKTPANPSFFTWYFSLFKYYQWVKRKEEEYTGFSTKLAAIKKKIFWQIGGFNTNYQDALVEDYEFGYRLRKNFKVLLDDRVKGKHFHPTFSQCFKNYYKRVYLWLKLFGKRKKFDNVTTTFSVGMGNLFGFLSLFFFLLVPFSFFFKPFLFPSLFSFAIFFWFYRDFHSFVLLEKGPLWMIMAILISLSLTLPIGTAFVRYLVIDRCFKIMR